MHIYLGNLTVRYIPMHVIYPKYFSSFSHKQIKNLTVAVAVLDNPIINV